MWQNMVAVNGDIYLCCQDWGLKHKIGNLKYNSLDSDIFNKKREYFENLLLTKDSDMICRKCEYSKISEI